jgi:hypothetical protein
MESRSRFAPALVEDVIDSLKTQGIAFRGPCWAHTKPTFFVINQSILLESELIDLLEQNKLNRDGIQELTQRIKAHSQQGDVRHW